MPQISHGNALGGTRLDERMTSPPGRLELRLLFTDNRQGLRTWSVFIVERSKTSVEVLGSSHQLLFWSRLRATWRLPTMTQLSIPLLPDEILSLVCYELGQDQDFSTLYECALAASTLADPALRTMYLMHEQSPTFIQSDEENIRQRSMEEFFRKWTILWRSIVASSLEDAQTYKPYCRYLRILDFRNLSQMLEDFKFTGAVRKTFFANGLDHLHFPKREFKRIGIDVVATVNSVGDAVIPKTYLLEEIAGNLSPGFLTRWISQSPKLQNLVLYDGDALAEGAGPAIARHCDHFKNLTVVEWTKPDADQVFAQYLDGMKADTLQYFEMISRNSLVSLSFRALGRHKSLRELKLNSLSPEAVMNLNSLKDCTEIETLVLEDNLGTVQLEALNNDVFLEVVQWLCSCTKLRDITIKKFFDGPAILARVAVAPGVRLTKLSLEGYIVSQQSAAIFHSALSEQKSLRSLLLKGNGEDTTPDELSLMVDALSNLPNLTELFLKDVSDEFDATHIKTIALSLPNLEDFWTSGGEIASDVLPILQSLKHLKTLTLYALTQFSFEAILDFLGNLDHETQKPFSMFLMAAHPAWALTETEQEHIQTYIRENLDGRFEFVPWREADPSDSEDDY